MEPAILSAAVIICAFSCTIYYSVIKDFSYRSVCPSKSVDTLGDVLRGITRSARNNRVKNVPLRTATMMATVRLAVVVYVTGLLTL